MPFNYLCHVYKTKMNFNISSNSKVKSSKFQLKKDTNANIKYYFSNPIRLTFQFNVNNDNNNGFRAKIDKKKKGKKIWGKMIDHDSVAKA